MRDQDAVERTRVVRDRRPPAQMRDAPEQHRIGQQPGTVELHEHGGVSEPRHAPRPRLHGAILAAARAPRVTREG